MISARPFLERWWRPLLFLAWFWALTKLLVHQRYTAFLRPEFGYVLGLGTFTLLGFLMTGMGERRSRRFGVPQALHALILLLPLAYLWNAEGMWLGAYAFQKRSLGLPTIDVSLSDLRADAKAFNSDTAAIHNPEPTAPRTNPESSSPQKSAPDENRLMPPLPPTTPEPQTDHRTETRPEPADVPAETTIYIVKDGDTLYGIARKHYGDGKKWPAIADANQELLGGSTAITPGMELRVPRLGGAGLVERPSDEPTAARDLERVQTSPVAAKLITLVDLHTAHRVYLGKRVKLIGVLHKNDPRVKRDFGKNLHIVFRFVITCCAADAMPVSVMVDGKDLPDLPEGAWVEVEGTFKVQEKNGRLVPMLKKSSMKKTPPPKQRYLLNK